MPPSHRLYAVCTLWIVSDLCARFCLLLPRLIPLTRNDPLPFSSTFVRALLSPIDASMSLWDEGRRNRVIELEAALRRSDTEETHRRPTTIDRDITNTTGRTPVAVGVPTGLINAGQEEQEQGASNNDDAQCHHRADSTPPEEVEPRKRGEDDSTNNGNNRNRKSKNESKSDRHCEEKGRGDKEKEEKEYNENEKSEGGRNNRHIMSGDLSGITSITETTEAHNNDVRAQHHQDARGHNSNVNDKNGDGALLLKVSPRLPPPLVEQRQHNRRRQRPDSPGGQHDNPHDRRLSLAPQRLPPPPLPPCDSPLNVPAVQGQSVPGQRPGGRRQRAEPDSPAFLGSTLEERLGMWDRSGRAGWRPPALRELPRGGDGFFSGCTHIGTPDRFELVKSVNR